MKIPPPYFITSDILELISKIEALRLYFSSLTFTAQIKEKIQRVSLLKSSLFSARIEGNPLNLSDIDSSVDTQRKHEIFNIMDAIGLIESEKSDQISKDTFIKLHKCILKNISSEAGYLRNEASAIFNAAGMAVYIPPSPSKVPSLLNNLLTFINSDVEKFPLITAFIAHLIFEKIHPFLDGNGRVGRILIMSVLKVKKWQLPFIVPIEEYLDEHKSEYYFQLDLGLENTSEYLYFMLGAFLTQLEKTRMQINEELTKKEHLFLPPRQEEIMSIIKDHNVASFDLIRRRFLKIPERTLRYDLKKLVDLGLVETTGETKGRYYRIKK